MSHPAMPPGQRRALQRRHRGGFTLVELMVTLTVAAILVAAAAPALGALVRTNRLAAGANELVTALQLARAEAARRGRPVSLCSSADGATCVTSAAGWEARRWLVFQDAASSGAPATSGGGFELIRVFHGLGQGLELSSPRSYLRFGSDGSVSPSTAAEQAFVLEASDCSGQDRRRVVLSRLGRVRTTREACA